MVINSNFSDAKQFHQALLKWPNNPFKKILIIEGNYNSSQNADDRIKNNLDLLGKMIIKELSESFTLFIFNDIHIESEFIAYINKKKGGKNVYIEDGIAAYNNHVFPPKKNLVKIKEKINYGFWYETPRILGCYKYIDMCLVFYPELIRPELEKNNIMRLEKDIITNFDKELLNSLINEIFPEIFEKNLGCMIILPNSENIDPSKLKNIQNILISIIKTLGRYNINSAIKYHPREKNTGFIKLNPNESVTIIPQSLPCELVFLATKNHPPKYVIGDESTALYTSRMIYGESTFTISMSKILCNNNDFENLFFHPVFQKLGIIVPDSYENILKLIEK
ncbi:polysialyltransferase family glycosyltransferase [Methanocalculus sp.]|uniref:polysialyltransferase family glycosyltransferase n=1 Tax=Methanocalculus sp. TaxID=2004547 RepID=UPI002632EE32|nr:polysialyltransferase family glycosyltransferase [Methanocalculus sp.]MDG6249246.1 polysialyltransferase family glycosyltransferase [Methanocalculus sp.]